MPRTSNVARLAGAVSLPVLLAIWGLLFVVIAGETTVTTWGVGLTAMVPVSAILVAATTDRRRPRTGHQYAVGLLAGALVISVAYVGVAAIDGVAIGTVAGVAPLELVTVGSSFSLLLGVLRLVDVRYVQRPMTATMLEDRYLDDPVIKE